MLSVGIVLCLFWGQGARAYGLDVAFIESEMVATAQWIAVNTDVEAVIAAHDIGALGYFGGRDILDLAGLVSPEVIPFIRDEARLSVYVGEAGGDYLMTLTGWYPDLEKAEERVFITEGKFAPQLGGTNMAVFRWHPGP